jgi:hypothetical protein
MRRLLLVFVACGSESGKAPQPAPVAVARDAQAIDAEPVRSTLDEAERLALPEALGSIERIVALPDGNFLVVAEDAIARVAKNLSAIDKSFGKAGLARVGTKDTQGRHAAIDGEGRILLAAEQWHDKQRQNMLVARFLPDGKLDRTFGGRGYVTKDFGNSDDRPTTVTPLPNGDIAVIGNRDRDAKELDYEGYLAIFDTAGKQKSVVFFDVIPNMREFVTRTHRRDDGTFALVGYEIDHPAKRFGVFAAVLAADGTLASSDVVERPVLGQPSIWGIDATRGHIYAGGKTTTERERVLVVRFTRDAKLDPTWGDNGVAIAPNPLAGNADWIAELLPTADGVLAVGDRNGTLFAKFAANGQLDPGFANVGILDDVRDTSERFRAAIVDGACLVAATYTFIARYCYR